MKISDFMSSGAPLVIILIAYVGWVALISHVRPEDIPEKYR